jgi:hypothetical protein
VSASSLPSSLLCSPPTPSPPSVAAPVPLAHDLPPSRGSFWAQPRVHLLTRASRRVVTGSPSAPVRREEWRGPPRLLGHPRTPVPWAPTPPDVRVPRPLHAATSLSPSDVVTSSASEMSSFRGCVLQGPVGCVPPHRPRGYPRRRQARDRSSGLSLSPGGFLRWMTD